MMTAAGRHQLLQVETTCGSLLNELQVIWDEVGESEEVRDKMLLQLEQECLQLYRRRVDEACHYRTRLHQTLVEIQAEIAAIASVLKERPPISQVDRRATLKEQLAGFTQLLEEICQKRDERLKQFKDMKEQVMKICLEINGSESPVDEYGDRQDLSIRKLDELYGQLQVLQQEKNERLKKVFDSVNAILVLCKVLRWDFLKIITEVHPSLNEPSSGSQAKSIDNATIGRLADRIQFLREEKRKRMQKLQDLGSCLIELWNLMDTPMEEQQLFRHVTCTLAAMEDEVTAPGCLSLEVLKQTEDEVERLEHLKASRMKELVLKKQTELEEVQRKAHIISDANITLDKTIATLESGMLDPAKLLENIEEQIGRAKEEAFSRKEIMERVEKWMAACEEENWLEDYNKDENRYNATRGAHINLKRAERARMAVVKIPGLLESLVSKTELWEEERGKPFMYDGVRLLSTLEQYNLLRKGKEEEKRRHRDQRRVQEQILTEQETLYGSKPSPNYRTPFKKATVPRSNSLLMPINRRLSLGGGVLHHDTLGHRANGTNVILKPSDTPTHKDTRKEKLRLGIDTPLKWASSDEENYPTTESGLKKLSRQPLSPVSTPKFRKKGQVGSTLMKAATAKSPFSGATNFTHHLTVSLDEENNTPMQNPPSFQQTPQSPPMEYSFEERRLGFHLRNGMHLNTTTTTWTGRL